MKIESTVSGTVLQILVAPGDEIEIDQEVIMIESMKMEIPIASEFAGTVDAILIAEADVIEEGAVLISLRVS